MGKPLISLIIPIYNVGNYIEKSLRSALDQTYKNLEYILVNDCTQDNSMIVVNNILNEDKYKDYNVKIINLDINTGLSNARNVGLSIANGEFLMFMDSDDEIKPTCVDNHYKAIVEAHSDFTIANTYLDGARSVHIKRINKSIANKTPLDSYYDREWSVSAWNKLYRAEFIHSNNLIFKRGILHEDILWSYQVAKCAKRIAIVKDCTYVYKVRANSITKTKINHKKIEDLINILTIISNDNLDNNKKKKFISYWCFNTSFLLLNLSGDKKQQRYYYSKLEKLSGSLVSIYSLFMKMPYTLFVSIFRPSYIIYKYLIKTF
jgi:glycosyltransferase involved in cell wall biosynthesis